MSANLQTLKGFRDFLPAEKRLRDAVAAQIKQTFQRFGFEPLETPTLEYASLLLGKYGTEADKLVYTFADKGERQIGLRYDQTVPTARVLAQYQNELPRYFRRYQIQNVFRADKPQKGRYREFTQCDADIFGSTDPIADAEILAVFATIYRDLGFTNLTIKINDRQTLFGTLEPFVTDQVSIFSLVQSIDKLDKQTADEIVAELEQKGMDKTKAAQAIAALETAPLSENLQLIITHAQNLGVAADTIVFTPTLARGLDYYTGMIFEGTIAGGTGSVGGGGRYDKLIESLGGPSIPAVGFGIGFDRTVEATREQNLTLSPDTSTAQVMVTVFSNSLLPHSLAAAAKLRQAGIKTEVYPTVDKVGKQFKVADQKKIPWVIIIGDDEASNQTVTLKNMIDGLQQTISIEQAVEILKK